MYQNPKPLLFFIPLNSKHSAMVTFEKCLFPGAELYQRVMYVMLQIPQVASVLNWVDGKEKLKKKVHFFLLFLLFLLKFRKLSKKDSTQQSNRVFQVANNYKINLLQTMAWKQS